MKEEEIDKIGKQISLAYKFHQGYGYFLSETVAHWLDVESLPNWPHKTILDLIAVNFLSEAATQGSQQARQYLSYFTLHGTYSGRQTIIGGNANLNSIESMVTAINLQKAIAPHFIPEFE